MFRAKAAFVKRTVISVALFAFIAQHILCCCCVSELFAGLLSCRCEQRHSSDDDDVANHVCHRSCDQEHENLPSPDSDSHRHHSCLGTHLYAAPATSGLGEPAAEVYLLPLAFSSIVPQEPLILSSNESRSWLTAWHHSGTPTLPLRAQLQVYLF